MKAKIISVLFICILIVMPMTNADAAFGIPDETRAATLIVPLMESSAVGGPHNTLIIANNLCANPGLWIHWEMWDIDGQLTGLQGNVDVSSGISWVSDMASIMGTASGAQITQLTDGDFYRGFLTIDLVTATTTDDPLDATYPFHSWNCLTGRTYYVRLSEGAANGMPMIHIEGGLAGTLHSNVRGLYQSGDNREEIDNHSRYYAQLTTNMQAVVDDPDDKTDFVITRAFVNPGNNGSTRIVLWVWNPAASNTPPAGTFPYWYFDEAGTQVTSTTISLPHSVNIIDPSETVNGWAWINDIPNNYNVFAFSFNAAEGSALETWEVMFESTVIAEW